MEDASGKILNDDKRTKYICPVDWQVFRTGMIQDVGDIEKPEQDKWDRIINIVKSNTLGIVPGVTPVKSTPLQVNLKNLNTYIYDTL